ncbi:MAG: methylenetetrahydrofolate reductase [Desulfobacterales bacterium]
MGLREKLDKGEFTILAEMEPPKGVDVSPMVTCAQRVKGRVDAFMVPEMSNAVMRMSALGGAMVLQNQGLEAVMQVNCRDRNRLALQADLLAGWACGIPSVMAVAGEDPSYGDHHQARPVHDIDLLTLLATIRKLCQGRDMAGIELKGAPDFTVGAFVYVGAKRRSPDIEIEELNKKAEAGAEFFITPPIFDMGVMDLFLNRIDSPQVKLIPTVMLLKSLGMARYMARNVDTAYIPDELIARIAEAPDKVRECIHIAAEMVTAIREAGFAGVMLATLGWEKKLPDILSKIQ